MKIGIVTNLYPPYFRGGAENVIVRTVAELLSQGHDVFIIAGAPKSVAGRGAVLDRSSTERVYRFYPRNIYFTLDDHKYPWPVRLLWHVIDGLCRSSLNILEGILRAEDPDVIITHNLKGMGLCIPQLIRGVDKPHIHVVHDLQLLIPSGLMLFGKEQRNIIARFADVLYARFCHRRFGSPDVVIFPSQYLATMYGAAGFFPKSHCVMLPNPAPDYKNVAKSGRSEGVLRLLFLGQLESHKGLVFLLEALRKYTGEVRLLIAGDGTLRSYVEDCAKEDKRLTYLGYMSREDIPRVISSVDAIVVPSLCYENSPTVIYESLQTGIPVLAARIGGVGELITEGETGFLFSPNDEQDLLRVIEKMNSHKDDFAQHRERMRAAVAPYALQAYVQKLSALIDQACALHNRR